MPTRRKAAVTPADRAHALNGRARGPSPSAIRVVVAAMALLAVAVAGPALHAPTPRVERTAQVLAEAPHGDAAASTAVLSHSARHPAPIRAPQGPAPGANLQQLLVAVLIASLFPTLLRLTRPASRSPHALPPRGPPHLAFLR